ncbi:MAG: HAMP domain-containing histidine kinase, partial [Lachnospiraceae bacterium]|nr:HAMP domain-containing histidine kinase [Lachnospiraceae bacterium]
TGAVYKFMDESYKEWNDRFLNEAYEEQEETVVEQSAPTTDYDFLDDLEGPAAFGGDQDDYQAYLAEEQAHYEEMLAAEYGYAGDEDYDGYYRYDGYYSGYYDYSDPESRDAFMEDMARNKNLQYAVVYQNKLLYTNMEAYEDRTGQEWGDADFYESLDSNEYNFALWYNRAGDGRVEITKDGWQEDVYGETYGDGVYSDESRWRVPGYPNFTIGESAKEAVIFLAAAKDPKLYMVREDENSHITQYGGRLYRMKQNLIYLHSAAERTKLYLTAAVVLLAVSLLLWKSRRQGVKKIADLLAKICLEGKILLAVLLAVILAGMGSGVLSQLGWWIRYGFYYYNWSGDYIYEMRKLCEAGWYLTAYFWLLYLAVLDFRMNRNRQKKPLFDLLKTKDFKYPIQKRLVRRQRIILIVELVLIMLFAVSILVVWLIAGEYLNYLSGGYAYDYGYEAIAEYGGYPFGLGGAYLLMAQVTFAALFIFTLTTFCSLRKNHRLAVDIGALSDQILAVREGNLTEELTLSEDTDLREAADNLNEIQKGMETALAERVKSERMKVDLVTNVSHDIKTPLTSIISYVELLRQEEELPQYVKEYIQILGEKSERLRSIVQDVFEVSKATSGQLPINMESLDLGKLLRQTLADMNGQIEESTISMKTAIPQEPVLVRADGQRLYRVFQNLLQNALRYSLEGSRVYLTLTNKMGEAVVKIKNTSSIEIADDKDFTERFVRGDESRTDGGSGLGLSIAKSFTEACGGSFSVETDADLFTVTVRFPENRQEAAIEEEKPEVSAQEE